MLRTLCLASGCGWFMIFKVATTWRTAHTFTSKVCTCSTMEFLLLFPTTELFQSMYLRIHPGRGSCYSLANIWGRMNCRFSRQCVQMSRTKIQVFFILFFFHLYQRFHSIKKCSIARNVLFHIQSHCRRSWQMAQSLSTYSTLVINKDRVQIKFWFQSRHSVALNSVCATIWTKIKL